MKKDVILRANKVEKNNKDYIIIEEIYSETSSIVKSLINNADVIKANITKLLYKTPSFIKLVKSSIPKKEYKVLFSSIQKARMNNGGIQLMQKKDGSFIANLINSKTKKIFSSISLKEVNKTPELSKALSNYMTQMQMAQIANRIQQIQLDIEEVRQGQFDDRFALAYSCEQKYIQASVIKNTQLKQIALLKIVSDAEDSRNLLMKTQTRNLEYIRKQPESFWKQVLSLDSSKKVNKRMDEIRESFNAINMTSIVEAVAYKEMGEFDAAQESLSYYANHLKSSYFMKKGFIEQLDLIDPSPENYWSGKLPEIMDSVQLISHNSKVRIEGVTYGKS